MRTKVLNIWSVVTVLAVATSMVVAFVPSNVFADHDPYNGAVMDKIILCHDESGDGTDYHSSGDVDTSSVINGGHGNHETDIIPPFHYQKNANSPIESYNGLNWNITNEDIWNRGACDGDGIIPPPDDTTLTVIKQTDPDSDPTEFDFELDAELFATLQDGESSTAVVGTGTHLVSEIGLPDWGLTGWTCQNEAGGSVGTDMGESGIQISFAAGDDITCTFTNTLIIYGCMDPNAWNFDETATDDDGSCVYDVCLNTPDVLDLTIPEGYEDPDQDKTCTEIIYGCTNPDAINYNPEATQDDQSCRFEDPTGSITVNKVVLNYQGDQTFQFNTSWLNIDLGNPPYDFGLVAGGSNGPMQVIVGTHSVTENVPVGWTLESAVCVHGDDSTSTAASIDVSENEAVTCTFTNSEDTYTIRGTKYDWDTKNGLSGWTIFIDENDNGTLDGEEISTVTDENGNYSFEGLTYGVYDVCEVQQQGYTVVTPEGGCHTVDFGNDESGVRDFWNERDEVREEDDTQIIVRKVTDSPGNETFNFDGSWEDFTLGHNDERVFDLEPGTYSVTEVDLPGNWVLNSVSCTGEEENTSIDLEEGEVVTCTFSNVERAGGGGSSGGGGGSSDEGEVLGEQTEILPAAAPNTGVPVAGVNMLGALSTLVGLLGLGFARKNEDLDE